ncbi:MAG: type II secretion system F family protein [Rhodococcus sp. (in: high G+C Gram-positive bacteria)]|jgi:tight adherence protein B|uniref:type II secretion system F family protein n=1 Tax=Rhodococcus sp. NPDC080181 TaxID=3155292 RepID=UPI00261EFED8|nr:type II secretion system F family protein [uncultured Rhodococcus sp.]
MYTITAVGIVILFAAGIWFFANGIRDRRDPTAPTRHRTPRTRIPRQTKILFAVGIALGLAAWLLSGWFVLFPIIPIAAVGVPYLLGSSAAADDIERLNALEEWVRNLTGVLAAGSGLEQAIIATHRGMPQALRPEITSLITRLRGNVSIDEALLRFADDLDDSTGDYVVGALRQAARLRGSGLTAALKRLSESVAENVRNRRTSEAERQGPRTTARWVTVITVALIAGLFLFSNYMDPYKQPLLQPVLFLEFVGFGLVLGWMKRYTLPVKYPRFIGTKDREAANNARARSAA